MNTIHCEILVYAYIGRIKKNRFTIQKQMAFDSRRRRRHREWCSCWCDCYYYFVTIKTIWFSIFFSHRNLYIIFVWEGLLNSKCCYDYYTTTTQLYMVIVYIKNSTVYHIVLLYAQAQMKMSPTNIQYTNMFSFQLLSHE